MNCSNLCLDPNHCEQGAGDLKDGNLGVSNGVLDKERHGSIEWAASQYKQCSGMSVLCLPGKQKLVFGLMKVVTMS